MKIAKSVRFAKTIIFDFIQLVDVSLNKVGGWAFGKKPRNVSLGMYIVHACRKW